MTTLSGGDDLVKIGILHSSVTQTSASMPILCDIVGCEEQDLRALEGFVKTLGADHAMTQKCSRYYLSMVHEMEN